MHNISKADEFLLLACDGLFDVFSNEEVCSFVKDFMTANKDSQKCVQVVNIYSTLQAKNRETYTCYIVCVGTVRRSHQEEGS